MRRIRAPCGNKKRVILAITLVADTGSAAGKKRIP
jgi:hypothetical protein